MEKIIPFQGECWFYLKELFGYHLGRRMRPPKGVTGVRMAKTIHSFPGEAVYLLTVR